MDHGKEFAAEVQNTIHNEYGIQCKLITTRNPPANAMMERVHQTMHNMIRSLMIRGKEDIDDTHRWTGILSAIRQAVIGTVHTTNKATPAQLVFGRDAILNIGFQANWEFLKQRKLKAIQHNNTRENARRLPHQYNIGDEVMIRLAPNRKHGSDQYSGPHRITRVNNNGTVRLARVAVTGGEVEETWNICQLDPCID